MQLQSIKDRVRDDIVKGSFDPEARLTIDMLASRYGSSHMPIREALRELAGEGLVRFEPRRGARTLPIDRKYIDNLLTMRAELEPLLARQAAARMDALGLARLEALQAELEAADLMVRKATALFDAGKPCGAEANMGRYLASHATWEAAEACFTAHGGFAFAREYHIERKWREARLSRNAPISPNLILSYVAQHVLGLPRSY